MPGLFGVTRVDSSPHSFATSPVLRVSSSARPVGLAGALPGSDPHVGSLCGCCWQGLLHGWPLETCAELPGELQHYLWVVLCSLRDCWVALR